MRTLHNLPSVKTLSAITSYPKELRKVLELSTWPELEKLLVTEDSLGNPVKPFGARSKFAGFKATQKWEGQCSNRPKFHHFKMAMADELCETCGVEYISPGHNEKSPAIEFLNTGDPYTATLLFIRGVYRVGCWGDIVERGNYD